MIVVVDTSTLISAALKPSGLPRRALVRAAAHPVQFVVSLPVIGEYRAVMLRTKFDRYVAADLRLEFLQDFITGATLIAPSDPVCECLDPDDDKFLELAVAGRADVIVSSDRHLLAMHPWRGLAIVNPVAFLAHAF